MITADIFPVASTLGVGFLAGALKKVMKIAAVIVGMFIGALAYLESPNNSSRLGNASVGLFTFDNDAIVSVRAAAASISPQMPYYDFLFLVDQCSSRLAAG
jgi:uncharacterized membrane protein (Fun14 family)